MTGYSASAPSRAGQGSGGRTDWLTAAACVGAAVNAGVFLAFSFFVMPAVQDLPDAQGITAMQALNRIAVAPFTLVGLGTAVLCLVVMVRGFRTWTAAGGRWMVVGAVVYLLAAIMLTFAANVPMSYTIDTLDPASADAQARWVDLSTQWVWSNHLRALGTLVAAAALATALFRSGSMPGATASGTGDARGRAR